ncbi:MAG: nuclear transport factor 2 family protein [Iamia sp.]
MTNPTHRYDDVADLLARYADAKNRRDVDEILSLCSPDSYYESVALGARIEGKPALGAFYSSLFAALPDYTGTFAGATYSADVATVWGHFGGTTVGDLMGLAVEAGRAIEIPVTFVCTFRDGQLASDVGYFDAATLAEQLGLPIEAIRPASDTDTPAARFVEKFTRLWATKDPDLVAEMVAPDATASWSGRDSFTGAEYPGWMRQVMANLIPDVDLRPTGHAINGDLVFISWHAEGMVSGQHLEWDGIDRFHLRDGLADEVHATFDPAPLRVLLEQSTS